MAIEAQLVDAYRRHDNDTLLELMDRWRQMGGTHKRARTLGKETLNGVDSAVPVDGDTLSEPPRGAAAGAAAGGGAPRVSQACEAPRGPNHKARAQDWAM